jgi:hypothetical protein
MADRILEDRKLQPQDILQKDIVLKAPDPSQKPAEPTIEEIKEIAREYEDEVKFGKYVNLVQGLLIGAGIGLFVCTVAALIGVNLDFREISAIIGAPAVLGIIAGYILS